jgi:trigger factor
VKVSVETLPSSEAVLNVDFSWEELEKASDKAYRKLVKQVDVQGFRRGKAPRSLLERKLGKEYIYQEGLDDLMTATYRDLIKEHSLVPLTQPELDAPILEIGQEYHFSIKVPILSPVELGDYRSLHFERPVAEVTSEEVEQELESLRERQVSWEEVERPAQSGDRVTMDLKLTSEEQAISDLKDNPFELTDERPGLFSGMDEHIIGMQVGEGKTFSTVIPEGYANEKLAGKTADYEVALHKVEFKQLPELDDSFAAASSKDEAQTLEDLRKSISDQLLSTKKRKINDDLREQVLKAVIEQSNITLHPVLVDEEAHEMMHQMSHILEQQRMSMDQYLILIKKSQEEYLDSLKPDAEQRVKQQLVLDEVIKKEEIQVTPEEIESLFRIYSQMGQQLPQTQEQIMSIANNLQREKAFSLLVDLTTDPDPDEEVAEVAVTEVTSDEEVAEIAVTEVVDAELVDVLPEASQEEVVEASVAQVAVTEAAPVEQGEIEESTSTQGIV